MPAKTPLVANPRRQEYVSIVVMGKVKSRTQINPHTEATSTNLLWESSFWLKEADLVWVEGISKCDLCEHTQTFRRDGIAQRTTRLPRRELVNHPVGHACDLLPH
jgi:hypothetical protein